MGIIDKFKDFFGYNDEYYDDEYDAEDYGTEPDMTLIDNTPSPYETRKDNNVVNINSKAKLRVVLVKPERFEEADVIADHLNEKRTVVLNLESANKDESRRLIDFLSGVAYANHGEIKRVANSTYLITPYNVDIQGDVIGELENSGIFFGG